MHRQSTCRYVVEILLYFELRVCFVLYIQLLVTAATTTGQSPHQHCPSLAVFCLVQILHVCYELASSLHVASSSSLSPDSKSIVAVRFWTDQLKRAIQTRYGAVGNSVDTVRQLLQHTKTVLRNKNGMDLVEHKFI